MWRCDDGERHQLSWAATPEKPGVNLLEDFTEKDVLDIAKKVQEIKKQGDIAVLSIPGLTHFLRRRYGNPSFSYSVSKLKLQTCVTPPIHWGSNWGYHIPDAQIEFAHQLIDYAGVDVVHGHSSHHIKGFVLILFEK